MRWPRTWRDKKAEKQLYLDAGKKDLADKVVYQEIDLEAAAKPLRDALPGNRDGECANSSRRWRVLRRNGRPRRAS